MKRALVVSIIMVVSLVLTGMVHAGEKAPQKVIDLANSELVTIGTNPVIVEAVKKENAKGKTLSQIKDMDKKWMATPGLSDFMTSLRESPCGKHLQGIKKSQKYYAEIFVMDNQGANVCMSDKTSDYWQGDEAKFKNSFKNGSGGVDISDVKFDDSSQAYVVQVSVPVKDGGKVIGAITFGIDVDRI